MNSTDILTFFSLLIASWSLGFAAGYILTKYREAMNSTV